MWDGRQVAAVIAAGGRGRRIGGEAPKQYLPVAGTPLLVRTLKVFQASSAVDAVVVAAREAGTARNIVAGHGLTKVLEIVEGGPERQDSVWNALECLRGRGFAYVLVHDAARPFIDEELISSVCAAAGVHGAAVPVLRPSDTVVTVDAGGMVVAGHDRALLGIVQTPQAFRFEVLYEACRRAQEEGFRATDDASLVRHAGGEVATVPGRSLNFKITTPDDFRLAEILVAGRKSHSA